MGDELLADISGQSVRLISTLVDRPSLGQRIYLAAEAVGLAARNLAAYLDDELDRVLGLDPERERVIHLTLLGREG